MGLKSDIDEKACFKEIEAGLGGLRVTTFVVVFVKGQLPTKTITSIQSIAKRMNLTKKTETQASVGGLMPMYQLGVDTSVSFKRCYSSIGWELLPEY